MSSTRFLLAIFLLAACSEQLPIGEVVRGPAILTAEKYQREIMEIDRLIFAANKIGESGRRELASKLEALSSRVDADRADSEFLGIQARDLKRLAARVHRISAGGPVPAAIRDRWMQIRSNAFDDRSWFARSAADLSRPEFAMPAAKVAEAPEETENPLTIGAPAHRQSNTPTALEGRWIATAITMNGKPSQDPEIVKSWWIFEGNELRIIPDRGSKPAGHYHFEIIKDEDGNALRLRSLPGLEPHEEGWMIYDREGGVLRLTFFDGLGERPRTLVPESPDQEPELVNVILFHIP